jgi:Tol biopolymer transport system component
MDGDGHHIRQLTRKDSLSDRSRYDDDPIVSPDGRHIAFERYVDGPHGDRRDIYAMRSDGTHVHRLTHRRSNSASPAYSPDGSRIAFIGGEGHHSEIYMMRPNGSHVRPLTHTPRSHYSSRVAYSPDGRRIVYVYSIKRDESYQLRVMNADGSHQRVILRSGKFPENPTYSPDGRSIAFDMYRENGLYMMRANGAGVRRVTNPRDHGADVYPSFSPDGDRIAFERSREAYPDFHDDIYTVRVDGTGIRRLTTNRAFDEEPDWGVSPSP